MTISSSLNAGVMGLKANSTRLATISDNIANSSTYGYKRAETDFGSMVNAQNGGTYSAGGVRTTTQRLISERGSLIGTSNSTDIAVRGKGMVPVTTATAIEADNGNPPLMLSTTGSFRPDSEGYLKSETGLVLMGWPADPDGVVPEFPRDSATALEPVRFNPNQFAAEPTTNLTIGANLPASSTKPGATAAPETLSVEYFDNLGSSESLSFSFTPVAPAAATDPATNQWTMRVTDSASSGATVGEYTLQFADTPTTGGTLVSATATDPAYDAYDPATGAMTIDLASGPLELNIGEPGQANGMTQLGGRFAPGTASKNGSSVGSLVDLEIEAGGKVNALFDTGAVRTIYQIPLADVANVNGLMSNDNQTYTVTGDSGPFYLWNAGDGPTGDIVRFAREESTTDVASELTDLIQTQRAYSSNAKVIQTVDEMLQETTNIKR